MRDRLELRKLLSASSNILVPERVGIALLCGVDGRYPYFSLLQKVLLYP
jgi:hypothetical protein